MYAIIKTGGKQYKVEEGQIIKIERLSESEEDKVEFNQVLAVSDDNGDLKVGQPFLEDIKVSGTILEHGKNKKVVVFKYKPKKRYRKKMGHRQPYTKVLIDKIEV